MRSPRWWPVRAYICWNVPTNGRNHDSSAALIVWEHRWAARVSQAIRDAGGRIIAGERVPDEIVEQALAGLATG